MQLQACSLLLCRTFSVLHALSRHGKHRVRQMLSRYWHAEPATSFTYTTFKAAEQICRLTAVSAGRVWASVCGSYSLQRLLNSQDAVLGPAVPGRDPLLDALNSFVGTPGSPPLRAWEQGLANQTDPAGQLTGQLHHPNNYQALCS